MKNIIVVLDFGGQYSQLIARRIREENVYSIILPYNSSIDKIKSYNPSGIIFSGGPSSVYLDNSPKCNKLIYDLDIPILGICYGMQLICNDFLGVVKNSKNKEFGVFDVEVDNNSLLFKGLDTNNKLLMSHSDYVYKLPNNFNVIATTKSCKIAGFYNSDKKIYGVQFHPEVNESINGEVIISNFLDICGCLREWKIDHYLEEKIREIKKTVGNKKVLCALSGGVDSSVAAAIMSRAVGKNLTCVFVDHGLLRKGEVSEVESYFKNNDSLNFIKVNAKNRFLKRLEGITDPEEKRKIIGCEFIKTFESVKKKLGDFDYLVQGTIYPDVIESGVGVSSKIKSHHNVGGLPDTFNFKCIIEPLRDLFKDEVRKIGLSLGLPKELINRKPFPGPGLSIRIIGEVNEEKLKILRDCDYIFREEIEKNNISSDISQAFAVLTNTKSVGVMGDFRTYEYTVALRAVKTIDFMTCEYCHIPYEILDIVSKRIVNEVNCVNRVVYDITGKPPATIEWE